MGSTPKHYIPGVADSGGPFAGAGPQNPPSSTPPSFDTAQIPTGPPVPGGEQTPGKGSTAVDTKAMRVFAKNLTSLQEGGMSELPGYLESVAIKPGQFWTATNKIQEPVQQLASQLATQITDFNNGIQGVVEAISLAATKYDSIDAANGMTADQYNALFGGASNTIASAGTEQGAGGGSSGATATGSGSGSGSGAGSTSNAGGSGSAGSGSGSGSGGSGNGNGGSSS